MKDIKSNNYNNISCRFAGLSSSSCKPSSCLVLPSQLWIIRLAFMTFLLAAAGGLGYASYHLLSAPEQDLADSQFDSIADRALAVASDVMKRNHQAVISMASIMAQSIPNAERYPNTALAGFDTIGANILSTSTTVDIHAIMFLPIVRPGEISDFEDFAYAHLETLYGPGVATSSFGQGIAAMNPALDSFDKRYHDVTGETSWDSEHQILLPIFQAVGFGVDYVRMVNVYSLADRGVLFDDMIECYEKKHTGEAPEDTACPSISQPFVFVVNDPNDLSPGAVICEPVFPVNNQTVMTGFVCQKIRWHEFLRNGFNQEIKGVNCVLETETQAFTWEIEDGQASYRDESDKDSHPCSGANQETRSVQLTDENVFGSHSVSYSLTICATNTFADVYSTPNPITATIGAVSIVFLMTLFFLLYDFVVRVEFHEKQSLLDAKRKFIRFVSHEVRTPLNSVCMGLKLLRQEVEEIIEAKEQQDQEHSGERPYSSEIQPEAPLPESFKDAKDDEDGDDVLDLTDQITRSAEAAVHVLDDFLNFDKIESGQLQLEYTVVNIWSLVEQCVKEFQIPYRSKGVKAIIDWKAIAQDIDVEMSITSSLDLPQRLQDCRVVGDEVRITQVFRNMLSNALKFTPKGGIVIVEVSMSHLTKTSSFRGGTLTEEFTLQDRKDKTSFCRCGTVTAKVIDSGVGMTEEQLQKLFSSGVQFNVNKLQAGKGSGLGLFISKGIVEQHKGTMTADSKGLGHGTSFNIALPLYHVPDSDPIMMNLQSQKDSFAEEMTETVDASDMSTTNITIAPNELSEASSSLDLKKDQHHVVSFDVHRSRRILVVDDAGINRKLLVRMLTREGHVCDQAQNGLEAVQAVQATLLPRGMTTSDTESNKQRPYDVILLDYEMPVMDGPTAAMKIRDLGCSNVLIVGITGNCLKEDVEHFESHGANAVLPKPFELAALEKVWTRHDRDSNKDLLFLNDQSGNRASMDESEIL